MAGKIFDNIVNMIEKRTKEKISPIQNEKIQNISISQNPDSGYARGDLIPVNFYVDIISLNDSINAKINFNIAQTDENGNPVKVLIYKVYRDTENEEGERAGFPELIAEISSSLITSGVFSFNDNGFPMGNVVYYTITCVDTTGFESPFGEWQRYEDSYPEINNLQLKDFEILEDKSVKINFDIELLRNYSHGFEEIGKEIETNNFLELLDFVQVREGNLLIDQFEELSYRFYPDKFSTTLNFRPRTKRGTVSSESLELKIGGTSPDISFDIGSLNAGSCSAEEDVYVNADGSSVSRIKLSLIAGSVVPSEVLIKARRKAIPPALQEPYFIVYDGVYESELIIEQGASTGWNKIQIGVDYQIQVFVKTSWGLIKDSPDYEEELKIEGSTEPPTPVYFVNSAGAEITSATTPKYFELDWGESVDFDDDMYELRISKTNVSDWDSADYLYRGRARKFVYTPTPDEFATYQTSGTIRFWIKSYNARGIAQTTARTIDITNNPPSKPNTPNLSLSGSGFEVSWNEGTEIDIDFYKIYVSENSGTFNIIGKTGGNIFSFSPNPGSSYSVKIASVDIYGRESIQSDSSNSLLANLTVTKDSVSVYPSGDTSGVTDKQTFNNAIDYLNGVGGGIIYISSGNYYVNISSSPKLKGGSFPIRFESMSNNPTINFVMTSDGTHFAFDGGTADIFSFYKINFTSTNNNRIAHISSVELDMDSCNVSSGKVRITAVSNSNIRNCSGFHDITLLLNSNIKNLIDSGYIYIGDFCVVEDTYGKSGVNSAIVAKTECLIKNCKIDDIVTNENCSCINCKVTNHIDQSVFYTTALVESFFLVDGCSVGKSIGQTVIWTDSFSPSLTMKVSGNISNSQSGSIDQLFLKDAIISNCVAHGTSSIDKIYQSGKDLTVMNSRSTKDIEQEAYSNNSKVTVVGSHCDNLIQNNSGLSFPTGTKGIATNNFISGGLFQTTDTTSNGNNL